MSFLNDFTSNSLPIRSCVYNHRYDIIELLISVDSCLLKYIYHEIMFWGNSDCIDFIDKIALEKINMFQNYTCENTDEMCKQLETIKFKYGIYDDVKKHDIIRISILYEICQIIDYCIRNNLPYNKDKYIEILKTLIIPENDKQFANLVLRLSELLNDSDIIIEIVQKVKNIIDIDVIYCVWYNNIEIIKYLYDEKLCTYDNILFSAIECMNLCALEFVLNINKNLNIIYLDELVNSYDSFGRNEMLSTNTEQNINFMLTILEYINFNDITYTFLKHIANYDIPLDVIVCIIEKIKDTDIQYKYARAVFAYSCLHKNTVIAQTILDSFDFNIEKVVDYWSVKHREDYYSGLYYDENIGEQIFNDFMIYMYVEFGIKLKLDKEKLKYILE